MTKNKQISEQEISELEDQILDVDTVMQDPEYVEPAIEFITLIDEKIQKMVPNVDENTPDQYIKRLQLCAFTLSKLAEKAEQHLGEIKKEILALKKNTESNAELKAWAKPAFIAFDDMKDLLLLDPIHETDLDQQGWPMAET